MYKEATKIAAAVAMAAMMTACGQSESHRKASELCGQAEAFIDLGDTAGAIAVLDSLQRAYPGETEVQRRAMHLRPQAIEKQTLTEISTVDSLLAMRQATYENLKGKMKLISSPDLVEPYYVYGATYDKDFMNKTAIEPRVSEIGEFYIISSVNPGGLKHQALTLDVAGESVTTGVVPYDGEMNYRINGSEVISFSPAQSDTLGYTVAAHPDASVRLTFNGEKKDKTVKLNDKQRDAIATCYQFSKSITDSREMTVKREKLERQLQIARDQIARTFNEKE